MEEKGHQGREDVHTEAICRWWKPPPTAEGNMWAKAGKAVSCISEMVPHHPALCLSGNLLKIRSKSHRFTDGKLDIILHSVCSKSFV